jgi:hypothetical protein
LSITFSKYKAHHTQHINNFMRQFQKFYEESKVKRR